MAIVKITVKVMDAVYYWWDGGDQPPRGALVTEIVNQEEGIVHLAVYKNPDVLGSEPVEVLAKPNVQYSDSHELGTWSLREL